MMLKYKSQSDFSHIPDTWIDNIEFIQMYNPDSALHLTNFQLFRADRDAESVEKSRGGRNAFTSMKWCTEKM